LLRKNLIPNIFGAFQNSRNKLSLVVILRLIVLSLRLLLNLSRATAA
jgi:hypothetical protein